MICPIRRQVRESKNKMRNANVHLRILLLTRRTEHSLDLVARLRSGRHRLEIQPFSRWLHGGVLGHSYDLVVLDCREGIRLVTRLCEQLRRQSDVGIVALVDDGDCGTAVALLDIGADSIILSTSAPAAIDAQLRATYRRVRWGRDQ